MTEVAAHVERGNMPRFRFQWANIPEILRTELARHLALPSAHPASFQTVFGMRPKTDFIQRGWNVLLDTWLFHDEPAALRIATALRARNIGDTSIDHELQYLQSCRNSAGLRQVVLAEFITLGEISADQIRTPPHHSVTTPSAPTQQHNPQEQANPLLHLLAMVTAVLKSNASTKDVRMTQEGDLQIPFGSSKVFLTIKAEPLGIRVFAVVLQQIQPSPALYETLNHININLPCGRIFALNDYVVMESSIPIEAFSPAHLVGTIETVGFIADTLDDRLMATFGGTMQTSQAPEDTIDV